MPAVEPERAALNVRSPKNFLKWIWRGRARKLLIGAVVMIFSIVAWDIGGEVQWHNVLANWFILSGFMVLLLYQVVMYYAEQLENNETIIGYIDPSQTNNRDYSTILTVIAGASLLFTIIKLVWLRQ